VVIGVKHVPEAHGVAAYDRLDSELANLGAALANRHKLPETIRVQAAARFFAHEYSQASGQSALECVPLRRSSPGLQSVGAEPWLKTQEITEQFQH